MIRNIVVLPQPDGPEEHDGFAARDIERHRLERAGAVAERLGAGLDTHRHAAVCRAHRRAPLNTPRSANNCIATSSGMIITKNTSV